MRKFEEIKTKVQLVLQKDFTRVTLVFTFSRILILILGIFCAAVFPNSFIGRDLYASEIDPIQIWKQWDIPWYESIAKDGYEEYEFSKEKMSVFGFMPLYPTTVGLFMDITPFDDFMVAGIILSNIFSLLAIFILYKYIKRVSKKADAFLFIICFLPGSFYLSIPYTESLYLLFIALVFYLTHRKIYLLAFLFCGLAIITRIQSLALIAIPLVTLMLDNKILISKKSIYLIIGGVVTILPILIYSIYLNNIVQEPFAFLSSQAAWNNHATIPFRAFLFPIFESFSFRSTVHGLLWFFYLVYFIRNYKKFTPAELVFMFGVFAISTSTEIFYGTYRYVLSLIPLYRVIAEEKGIYKEIYFYVTAILMIIFVLAFVTGNTLAV